MSDYALGDMMERTVKVSLDREKLSTIDALYISHAHSDHFDPYTLMEIYRHAQPIVFLPFTLRYLGTLIEEYIPSIEIHFLDNHTPFFYRGVEITGHMYQNPEITNEDDVMMLEVANDHEMLLAEIDTIPDMYDESVAKSLHRVFTRKSYETACYIASRNMLE
jgi:ribonuclease BN (tRNA processing enzyme)